jgi:transcriptional regulator with XRE-family HTH domain
MSLYDVAQATDLHFSTIGKYERGERRPSLETLGNLANIYQVDMRELLDSAPLTNRQDVGRLLNRRPDLEGLLAVAERLTPGQVLVLTDFLRSFGTR